MLPRSATECASLSMANLTRASLAARMWSEGRSQALDVELGDVVGQATDRAGGLLVVPGPEHVAAGDLGQLGVLPQQPRDLFVEPRHSRIFSGCAGGRPPG